MSETYQEQIGVIVEKNETAGTVCKKNRRLISTIIAGLGLIGLVKVATMYADFKMDSCESDNCAMEVVNHVKKSLGLIDDSHEKTMKKGDWSPEKPEIKPTPKPSKTEQPTKTRIRIEDFDDEPDTSIA